ncbi:hypothetical protein DFH07DRAFT_783860 [Mycena maculata]|uniref:Uncharacterized protein n=1 Tax=Mycena maculata TaxID=230809 RepID=A0AAD7HJN4_9AGAR|nr:hypothetical protein DFH07DRAFT_783860 [Mycena maculata]
MIQFAGSRFEAELTERKELGVPVSDVIYIVGPKKRGYECQSVKRDYVGPTFSYASWLQPSVHFKSYHTIHSGVIQVNWDLVGDDRPFVGLILVVGCRGPTSFLCLPFEGLPALSHCFVRKVTTSNNMRLYGPEVKGSLFAYGPDLNFNYYSSIEPFFLQAPRLCSSGLRCCLVHSAVTGTRRLLVYQIRYPIFIQLLGTFSFQFELNILNAIEGTWLGFQSALFSVRPDSHLGNSCFKFGLEPIQFTEHSRSRSILFKSVTPVH